MTLRDVTPGDAITMFLGVRSFQLRTTQGGRPYAAASLFDATTTLDARVWGYDGPPFPEGGVVKVQAAVEDYNDALQLKVERIRAATIDEVQENITALVPAAPMPVDDIKSELAGEIDRIGDEWLRQAGYAVLNVCPEFWTVPAGTRLHHAYRHGLAYHVLSMIHLVNRISGHYQRLNKGLLVIGCLVHDIGKTVELSDALVSSYTDTGRLVGHMAIGVQVFDRLLLKAGLERHPVYSPLIEHMIVSHHGDRDKGAIVEPATAEAIALAAIDRLDAGLDMYWKATEGQTGWVDLMGRRYLCQNHVPGEALIPAPANAAVAS